jgi:putative spermidine/putrescine transport system ATP-binding protein
MVFQSYAIWPHMSVGENVAFPLQARGIPKSEISQRTASALAVVGMKGFTDRPATQLSGGQQQRVALARAIVHQPKVLLLDEPLSNLDVKLREQMQVELKAMHRNLGWTVINVTHDQAEAMGVSDRIAVMDHGRIAQVGTPRELYENPATKFVREFLGKSVTLNGEVVASSGKNVIVRLACDPHDVLELANSHMSDLPTGNSVEISIRPEHIHLEPFQARTRALTGLVTAALYQGERTLCEVEVADERILLYLPGRYRQALGQSLTLHLETDFMRVWAR